MLIHFEVYTVYTKIFGHPETLFEGPVIPHDNT